MLPMIPSKRTFAVAHERVISRIDPSFLIIQLFVCSSPIADDDDIPLEPPQLNEIKEGQWLGVTVSTQKNDGSGYVS